MSLNIDSLTPDTANSDLANTSSDWITNNKKPVFGGSFAKAFDKSNDTLSFQILSSDGNLITTSSPDFASDNKSWSTPTSLTASGLADGTYYARVMILDKAGNVVSTDSQKFIIDTVVKDSNFNFTNSTPGGSTTANISDFKISVNENISYIVYKINIINNSSTILAKGEYTGNKLFAKDGNNSNTDLVLNEKFEKGEFKIELEDAAGNIVTKENTTEAWTFSNQKIEFVASQTPLQAPDTQKSGVIGSYSINDTSPFDLSKLVIDQPKTNDSLIHNEIDLAGHGIQQLSLHLNDILNLGNVNSFTSASSVGTDLYMNDVHLRIKGDAEDKVTLLDSTKWGHLAATATIDNQVYQVFTANNATVDLFIQDGVHVYKSDGTLFV